MSDKTDRDNPAGPAETGLRFFGRMSASVSHELNNVMTIILEKSGLLSDLAHAMETGRELNPARVREIGESFTRQAGRGVDMLKQFNRFAHSVDDPHATFELKALVENLACLAGRFAMLKKIELKTELDEAGLNIHGDPFAAQHIIFASLEAAMAHLAPSGSITISARGAGDDALVHLSASPAPENGLPGDAVDRARELALAQGAHLDVTNGVDAIVITLTIPRGVS